MLKKIHHVGVVVKSADEAMKFYRDALGLEVTEDRVIEDQGVARKILEHLGLPARAPPRGRPWRSGQQQLALHDDADRFDGDGAPPFEN